MKGLQQSQGTRPDNSNLRLGTIDILRGIAALGVCWLHLTNGNTGFLAAGILKTSGSYGWLGVEVFFVISGFIIPYSLYRTNYHLSDYGTFLLKRIIRLDPPYLVSILIVLALGYASGAVPGFHGPAFQPSLLQILLHLGYLNVFFGLPWLNGVFWTLAIELQYYLIAGLLFSAIARRSLTVRAVTFASLAGLAFLIPAGDLVFHWLFLFMLGMAAFQFRVGLTDRREYFAWIILFALGSWHTQGALIMAVGLGTSLTVAFVDLRTHPIFLFLGQISYSLYLLHSPIGGRIINLSDRFTHSMPGKIGFLAAALAASLAAAWLLYRFVERPAQRWSSAIRYRIRTAE